MEKDYCIRIQSIVDHFCRGNLNEFARITGLHQATLQRNLSQERGDLLIKHAQKILDTFPGISKEWLYSGEGEMLDSPDLTKPLTVQNNKGQLVGDLLATAIAFAGFETKGAAKLTGIGEGVFQQLLDSRLFPTFAQLEALHTKLGIEPSYFFTGDEMRMLVPDDTLLRVLWAVGYQGRTPTPALVADIFNVPKEEAADFLQDWQSFRKQGMNRVLPPHWEEALREHYCFNPAFLRNLQPPMAMRRKEESFTERERLFSEKTELDEKVRLQSELLEAKDKIIALYEQQKGIFPSPPLAPIDDVVALSARQGSEQ